MAVTAAGLEGVVATTTEICSIENGVLSYRGINIDELAEKAVFGEVVYLLYFGRLPKKQELQDFRKQVAEGACLDEKFLQLIRAFPTTAPPMEWLRTAVSALAFFDPDFKDNSEEANLRKSIRLVGQMSTLVCAYDRLRRGEIVLQPVSDRSIAWNFLYMLTGKEPDEVSEKTLDVCLILHADHELNASTFSARVTAATLSDMHSAVTSAVGTLKGPLHGGANEQVMRMLEKIRSVDRAESYIHDALARKERIMGFGHRVYKSGDPRAKHLRKLSESMSRLKNDPKWYEISVKVDEVVQREKGLMPNVDFYSASTYHYLGIPTDLFTPIFACSRVSGWCAHIMEQLKHNRLIRPRAEYLGPRDQHYVPIDQR